MKMLFYKMLLLNTRQFCCRGEKSIAAGEKVWYRNWIGVLILEIYQKECFETMCGWIKQKIMDKKGFIDIIIILTIISLSPIVYQGCTQNKKRDLPNIVFVLIDTLRPDHLGCYGYSRNTSPNIDGLANEGVLFKTTNSQAPWTKPSVASFFTSTLPSTHGVTWKGRNKTLPESMLTLAEVLKQNSYKTAAFSDNPHINQMNGFDQGFDTFVENDNFLEGNAESLTNEMLSWLRENYKKRHFIYIHYLGPHDPYNAPGIYHDMFLNKEDVDVRKVIKRGNTYVLNGEYLLDKKMEGRSIRPEDYPFPDLIPISQKELEYLIGLYDGEIRYVDDQVGRIMATLKELKLYDKTTIIITSDHGEEFLEHGMFRHGYHLYNETIKVPLILISSYFNKRPAEIETPVNLIDLMPTILDLLNIPFPSSTQGKTLVPFINRGKKDKSPSISETSWKGSRAQSLGLAEWKYINDKRNEREELYNLTEDSGEENNLCSKKDEKAGKLSHLLANIISKTRPVTEKSQRGDNQLEKKQLDKLKSLGYVQ